MLIVVQALARFYLFVSGMLALVVALRSLVDERSVAAWRASDAIWGPSALPFNAAGGLATAFAFFYGVLSPAAFSSGVRWRLAPFFALGLLVQASRGGSGSFLAVFLIAVYAAACWEAESGRKETAPLSSRIPNDV